MNDSEVLMNLETGGVLVDLRYYYPSAYNLGENRHAQDVMKELGISYQYIEFHPISDQVHFLNCSNVPSIFPKYLERIIYEQ